LDQALKAYGDRNIYYPEKARALYMRSKLHRQMNRETPANCDQTESLRLYRIFAPDDQRPWEALTNSDFDKIIVFWSR
jgi:hypothetical protein